MKTGDIIMFEVHLGDGPHTGRLLGSSLDEMNWAVKVISPGPGYPHNNPEIVVLNKQHIWSQHGTIHRTSRNAAE
jgi:hypothetical protein